MSFGDCRSYTQALAGALTGRLGQYTVDTAERLESTITNRDGRLKIEVICLAEENKAIIRETTIGDPATICWHAGCPR
ncbi:hypothetical protein SAMN05421757_109109 [Tropicimonas sediminicola]|uniref:Uncharacterized protein n=2 Tax=Tropicimonas sediminicola TaxID=1031541 RepID=A0A239LD74_9RHOB|nr:hypothetical protein SAMN05421757_109109 [Tropicimonas sediminicola]